MSHQRRGAHPVIEAGHQGYLGGGEDVRGPAGEPPTAGKVGVRGHTGEPTAASGKGRRGGTGEALTGLSERWP